MVVTTGEAEDEARADGDTCEAVMEVDAVAVGVAEALAVAMAETLAAEDSAAETEAMADADDVMIAEEVDSGFTVV